MRRVAVAMAVLALAAPAHADLVSAGGKLRARDGHVLGVDAKVELAVAPDVARLVANVGAIDGTSLVLPTERFPQLALVAALDASGAVIDWLAIPLAGRARVKVETARGASVVVRIAGRDTPPMQAARGEVTIPVVVPPGITEALAIATAKNGNVTEKPVALGTHPFGQALAVCTPGGVTVLAIEPTGGAATTMPAIATSSGTTSAARVRGPGWFEADVSADTDTVTVTAGGSTCTIAQPPIAPASVRLVADRARHVAGDPPIALRVELAYPGARSRVTPQLELVAETGTIASDRWTLPAVLAGKRTARARVIARWPGGVLEAAVDVALAPAAPARLEVAPVEALRADGETRREVVVAVLDRFGNPTTAALRARARGQLGAFRRRADGKLVARYTAPHSRIATEDRIEVSVDGITTSARVPLLPMPRRFAASVRAGVLGDLSPLVAATAEVRAPVLGDRLALGLDAGMMMTGFDVMADSERVTGTVRAAPLLARVALHERRGKLAGWIGGGAGVAFVSTRVASASAGTRVEAAFRPAVTGFAGVGYGSLGLELGYVYATLPGDGSVQGKLGGVTGTLGYRVEL